MVQEHPGSPLKKKKHFPFSGSQLFHQFIPSIPHNYKQIRNTWHDNKNNQKKRENRTHRNPSQQKKDIEIRVATMGGLLGVFLEGNWLATELRCSKALSMVREITQSSGSEFLIPNNKKCPSNRNQAMIHPKLLDFPYFFEFVLCFSFISSVYPCSRLCKQPAFHPCIQGTLMKLHQTVAVQSLTKATRFYETFRKIISYIFHLKTTVEDC